MPPEENYEIQDIIVRETHYELVEAEERPELINENGETQQLIVSETNYGLVEGQYSPFQDSTNMYGYGFNPNFAFNDNFDIGNLGYISINVQGDIATPLIITTPIIFSEKLWIQNNTNSILTVPVLNIGLPTAQPIDILKYADLPFLKENANEIFDWIEKNERKLNIFYQKNNEVPILGINNIKNIILEQNTNQKKEESFEDFLEI
jgi:hypothetical protein